VTREVSKATLRFLEGLLAPLMVLGHGAVVTAAENSRLDDDVDQIDAALPVVEADDDLAA